MPRLPALRFALLLTILAGLAGCAAPRLILADHPLAGRIWDSSRQRFIAPAEAEESIAAADIALLGEMHDNPVHHAIQGQILKQLLARGKRPALALEQIDTEHQPAVDAAARATGATASAIVRAGQVAPSWQWRLYKALVTQALQERLPIVAANLSRPRAREIASGGLAALGQGEAARLGLEQPWTAEQNASLRQLLVNGHCGDESPMIDKLIHVQRSKDAVMADRILEKEKGSGAVAIIGRVHARIDIGVPLYLQARGPEKRVLSLGLVEVQAEKKAPEDYPDIAPGLHHLVWFTPQVRREEPCLGYKRHQAK